jgi:hypothetical protein
MRVLSGFIEKFSLSIIFFLLLLPALSSSAQAPDYSSFAGVFIGTVYNEGAYNRMVTTLVITPNGRLRGDYIVEGDTGTFNGNLSNPRISDSHTLSFEWTDKHGEGFEVLEFSGDYNSFSGYWGNRDSPTQHPMSGKRQ